MNPDRAEWQRKVFHDQVEWFIRKWAPERCTSFNEHTDFVCDLMLVVRDLGIQGQEAYCDVATKAMKRSLDIAELSIRPVITQKDPT